MTFSLSPSSVRKIAIISFIVMIIIQICLIVSYIDAPQLSDYGEYASLAYECHDSGAWYPMPQQLYDNYIFAPGLINWLVLQLKLFGTLKFNMILNLLLNIGIIAMIFSFARKYFSVVTAWWSVAIYAWLYSTWWCVIPAGTEVPFLSVSLFGVWAFIHARLRYALFAGVCFAVANWIRPLVIIFVAFAVFALVVEYRRRLTGKRWLGLLVALALGYGLSMSVIGYSSLVSSGEWITKSSTGGVNLAYTANDKAYGGVASSLLCDSTNLCFIEGGEQLTAMEKDRIWRGRAIEWIKQNPAKYVKFYVMKFGGLFAEDAWPDRSVLNGAGMVDAYVHGNISFAEFLPHVLMLLAKSLVYYMVLVLFVVSLVVCRKSIFTLKGIWLLLLLAGVCATCVFAVTPRYHYPFLFIIVIWTAYGVSSIKSA